jgi:hypothetical protein
VDGDDWLARDWAAANRRTGRVPDLSGPAIGTGAPGDPGPPNSHRATPDLSLGLGLYPGSPAYKKTAPAHIRLTRAWALVKMATLAASTWWTMSAVHAHLGAIVCAYGAVALFSGLGARWRKRYFGPGQQLEPELYEALGSLLYRVGTGLVLAGGVVAIIAPGLRA